MNMSGVYQNQGFNQPILYGQQYPYNPYANQQRMEQPQNYLQPVQQVPQQLAQQFGINGKIVPAVENITANDVPMDGSIAFFPKQDMSEIYTKSWNSDGTIRTIVFKPVLNDCPSELSNGQEKLKFDLSEDVKTAFDKRFDELVRKTDELGKQIEQLKPKTATSNRKKESDVE